MLTITKADEIIYFVQKTEELEKIAKEIKKIVSKFYEEDTKNGL